MRSLRKYQEVCCDYIDKHLKNYKRPFVYCLPTGSGKTLVVAEIAKRWGKVLVLEESFPFDKVEHARWLYTVCTRPEEKLVLVR